jgi:hypothetical protein
MRWFATAVLALVFAPAWIELAGSGSGGGVSATPNGASNYPSLAFTSAGRPVIAWEEYDTTVFQKGIYLRRWDGTAWAGLGGSDTGLGISGIPADVRTPSLALDSADRPVVAWSHDLGIHVRRWDGTAWAPYGNSGTGFGVADGFSCFVPKIRLDASDRPVVAWYYAPPGTDTMPPTQVYLKRWNGTSWEELGGSASGGGVSNSTRSGEAPDLALDPAGHPVVAWTSIDRVNGGAKIYVRRWDGAAWVGYGGSDSGNGIGGTNNSSGESPSIAIGSDGNPVVAWHEYGDSFAGFGEIYVRKWDGNSWVELAGSASESGISASGGTGARYPSLRLDSADRPIVAWQHGPIFVTDEIYVKQWNGTAWIELAGSATGGGVSQTSTVPSGFASLALTPAGVPGVAWTEGFSNIQITAPEIFYRELGTVPDPPLTVTAMVPAPGSVVTDLPSTLTVTLSEAPDPSTVHGVSVTLTRAGKDGILGTSDDVALAPAVSSAGSQITVDLSGLVLLKDLYRLRVRGTDGGVRKVSGELLDGEFGGTFPSGNGSAGGDFVADFTLDAAGRPK